MFWGLVSSDNKAIEGGEVKGGRKVFKGDCEMGGVLAVVPRLEKHSILFTDSSGIVGKLEKMGQQDARFIDFNDPHYKELYAAVYDRMITLRWAPRSDPMIRAAHTLARRHREIGRAQGHHVEKARRKARDGSLKLHAESLIRSRLLAKPSPSDVINVLMCVHYAIVSNAGGPVSWRNAMLMEPTTLSAL